MGRGRQWIHLILVISLFIAAACGDSGTQPGCDSELPGGYYTLKCAYIFKGSRVGFGGITPPEVIAFRRIMGYSESDRLFKRLFREAATPGRLYALAGIYFTDPEAFQAAIQPYLESSEQVETFFGCIRDRQVVGRIAASIASGDLPMELKGP